MNYSRNLNDPIIELPFFQEMVGRLKGVERKDNFNGFKFYEVECPECGKRAARMGYFKKANTFAIECPVNGCVLNKKKNRKGLSLNDLIKHHGGIEMFDRWCKARGQFNPKNAWKGIKNRKKSYSSNSTRRTFKEKLELKSLVLMTKVRMGKFVNPDSYYYTFVKNGDVVLNE